MPRPPVLIIVLTGSYSRLPLAAGTVSGTWIPGIPGADGAVLAGRTPTRGALARGRPDRRCAVVRSAAGDSHEMIMNGMDKVNQEVFIKDKKHHDKSAGRESRQSRFARQPVMSGGAMIDTTRRECQVHGWASTPAFLPIVV